MAGAGSATVVAGAASSVSAAKTRTQSTDESDVVRGGELNLTSTANSTLDPIQSTDTASGEKIVQVYEGLTHYPNGIPSVEPQLIDTFEISDDLRTYTFKLKESVKFHDGTELTAADVKFSWRRLAESPNSQRSNFILGELGVEHDTDNNGEVVPDSLAITVTGDYTFEVRLREPNPVALDIITNDWFGIMPEGLVGDIEGYEGQYTQEEISTEVMVGTGPLTFETWQPGSEVRMTAFDEYHATGPYVDSVHWAIFTDDDAEWEYIINKEANVFEIGDNRYDPELVDAEEDDRNRLVGTYGPISNGEELEYTGAKDFITFYGGFNARKVPQSVRQAVAYVTDHDALITDALNERAAEAVSLTPPSMWMEGPDGYDDWVNAWPYGFNEVDTQSAESVLEDDGYTEDDPFELTFTVYNSTFFKTYGEMLKTNFEGLGVNVTVEVEGFNELLSRGQNGDLAFYSLGWAWGWDDPAFALAQLEPENTNTDEMENAAGFYLNWQDASGDFDEKAQDAWETAEANQALSDADTRAEAYVKMEEARRDDAILLPLYHTLQETFRYKRVEGPRPGGAGNHRRQYNEIWLQPVAADYANNEGVIDTPGLRRAIDDWRGGAADTDVLREVIDYWRSGEQVDS